MALIAILLFLIIFFNWSNDDQDTLKPYLGYILAAIFVLVAITVLFLTQIQY